MVATDVSNGPSNAASIAESAVDPRKDRHFAFPGTKFVRGNSRRRDVTPSARPRFAAATTDGASRTVTVRDAVTAAKLVFDSRLSVNGRDASRLFFFVADSAGFIRVSRVIPRSFGRRGA